MVAGRGNEGHGGNAAQVPRSDRILIAGVSPAAAGCAECRIAIEERAAILEFDAGFSRADAEDRARATARCAAHPVVTQAKLWRAS